MGWARQKRSPYQGHTEGFLHRLPGPVSPPQAPRPNDAGSMCAASGTKTTCQAT